MKSGSPESGANSTGSPKEIGRWRSVDVDRTQGTVVTAVGQVIVADGWSRTRIHGAQESATVVYRDSDARRETMRRRLREALDR